MQLTISAEPIMRMLVEDTFFSERKDTLWVSAWLTTNLRRVFLLVLVPDADDVVDDCDDDEDAADA